MTHPNGISPDLKQIEAAFQQEFDTKYTPATTDALPAQLWVALPVDADGQELRLEFVLLPHEDNVYAVQAFVLLPFACVPRAVPDLARLIVQINLRLPLIGFGMGEAEGWVFFRQIGVVSPHKLDAVPLLATAWLIAHLVHVFTPVLKAVARGERAFVDCLPEVQAHFAG